MKHKHHNKGFTLIELTVGMLIMILISVGCYTLIRTSFDSQWFLMNQNNANMGARTGVDTMADNLRGLTTLSAAAATDVTFTTSAGSVRYWRNSADSTLRSTTAGLPSGGTVVLQGLTALSFTYYSWGGSSWASSSTPGTLTSVGAMDITATVTLNGYARQVFSSVKLRQVRFNNTNGF